MVAVAIPVSVCVCVPNADPVNAGALIVPVAVVECVCVPRALPANVGAVTVPAGVKLTVPFVPAGVNEAVPLVPAGVPALTAEEVAELPVKGSAPTEVKLPVKACASTVKLGAVALQAVVEPVPAAILVAAQLPEVVDDALVPRGVILTVPLVPVAVRV